MQINKIPAQKTMTRTYFLALSIFLLFAIALGPQSSIQASKLKWRTKMDPDLLEQNTIEQVEYLVFLTQQANIEKTKFLPTKLEKGHYVVKELKATAESNQAPILEYLTKNNIEHRAFWIANMIWVRSTHEEMAQIAERNEVARIFANNEISIQLPEPFPESKPGDQRLLPGAVEWNIDQVNAPKVWEAGYTGQGVVIGGQDTGYDWDHPALINKYRGWNGSSADHNYNWHDSIHSGGGVCGPDSNEPCDDYSFGHGTHTMGTMIGDDGGSNQIGMAPGAKWIGCRNMDQGNGTLASYIECFEWFLEPTDLNGENGNSDLAPHVVNNSWYCPPEELCDWDSLMPVVNNTRAAGIVVVVSTGNFGSSGCGSVNHPPAIYEASFSVGATDSGDIITGFSSRGPSDYTNLLKPNVSAPGYNVRSSIKGGSYGTASGTSMAAPHVTGLVALLLSARPDLIGQVDQIENIIERNALPRITTETCGGIPAGQVPNNTYGWGRIDAYETLFDTLIFPLIYR
ncbi:MAG: S8 family serine peptidase [Anaerolineales bacterium]|jgi:serine protease AprX